MNSRILPLLSLAAAIGIFFAYVSPTWSGPIAAAKANITSGNEALVAAAAYDKHVNELASARSAIPAENMDRLDTFLPDSVDNVGLIIDLSALAAKSGLSLSGIDVQKPSDGQPANSDVVAGGSSSIGSATMSLSTVGTYAALQTFLRGIEKSARLLDVRDISVSGSDTGVYTYAMTIRLYWLR